MEVTFINVGYGDAILIQANGFTMLLDGGSAMAREFNNFPYRIRTAEYLKLAGLRHIDLLILSHIHEDHVCGLEAVVEQFTIGEIRIPYDPDLFSEGRVLVPAESAPPSAHLFSAAFEATVRILKSAKRQSIPVSMLQTGDCLSLTEDVELAVLAPPVAVREAFERIISEAFAAPDPSDALIALDRTSNDSSLLLKLCIGDAAKLLLTADNCPDKWNLEDLSSLKNVNVLKLPHHGQKDSVYEEITAMMPLTHVITTASSDRRYRSANPEVYETLLRLNPKVKLLFTDEREYLPYFKNQDGARAIKLVIDSRGIHTEFIK